MSFYRNTIRKSILITLSQRGICLIIREVSLVPDLVSLSKTLKHQTLRHLFFSALYLDMARGLSKLYFAPVTSIFFTTPVVIDNDLLPKLLLSKHFGGRCTNLHAV